MKPELKYFALLVLAVALIAGGVFAEKLLTRPSDPIPCVAGPGEECPNAEFLKAYREWDDLARTSKDVIQFNGLGAYLNAIGKPGKYFNHDLEKWESVPPAYNAPQSASITPSPATQPAPAKAK